MSYMWVNLEYLLYFYLYKVNSTLHDVKLDLISTIIINTVQTHIRISLITFTT